MNCIKNLTSIDAIHDFLFPEKDEMVFRNTDRIRVDLGLTGIKYIHNGLEFGLNELVQQFKEVTDPLAHNAVTHKKVNQIIEKIDVLGERGNIRVELESNPFFKMILRIALFIQGIFGLDRKKELQSISKQFENETSEETPVEEVRVPTSAPTSVEKALEPRVKEQNVPAPAPVARAEKIEQAKEKAPELPIKEQNVPAPALAARTEKIEQPKKKATELPVTQQPVLEKQPPNPVENGSENWSFLQNMLGIVKKTPSTDKLAEELTKKMSQKSNDKPPSKPPKQPTKQTINYGDGLPEIEGHKTLENISIIKGRATFSGRRPPTRTRSKANLDE